MDADGWCAVTMIQAGILVGLVDITLKVVVSSGWVRPTSSPSEPSIDETFTDAFTPACRMLHGQRTRNERDGIYNMVDWS